MSGPEVKTPEVPEGAGGVAASGPGQVLPLIHALLGFDLWGAPANQSLPGLLQSTLTLCKPPASRV